MGIETIQGTLSKCLNKLLGEEIKVYGASRTDSGVHALWQVAAFNTLTQIPLTGMQRMLNLTLPPDIVVKKVEEVALDFDPRRGTKYKSYVYRILNGPYRSALYKRFSWFIYHQLDVNLMNEAAKHLVGRKDFTSFRASGSDAPHSVREIHSLNVCSEGDFVTVEINGTAFLRHMVRIIVGTLVSIGEGKVSADDLLMILDAKDRTKAGKTAPPQGLFLKEIAY